MKKALGAVVVMVVTVLVVACGGGGNAGGGSRTDVHMGQTNFTQASITISKGSSLNLINDTAVTHIIANGTWEQNTARAKRLDPSRPLAPFICIASCIRE